MGARRPPKVTPEPLSGTRARSRARVDAHLSEPSAPASGLLKRAVYSIDLSTEDSGTAYSTRSRTEVPSEAPVSVHSSPVSCQ